MRIKIDNLSEHDAFLLDELNRCRDAHRCYQIAEEAESDLLKMEANRKCIRIYREDEYFAGSL